MRSRCRSFHRYLSLAVLGFWLLQAASGIFITFRSELDDWQLGYPATVVDPHRLGREVDALNENRGSVSSVWASGGRAGQFDVYMTEKGEDRTIRLDGSGRILRDRPDSQWIADGAIYETITAFHQTLLLRDIGAMLVGVSGILLVTNICLGLRLALREGLRRRLFRVPSGSLTARLFGWHRLLGLWMAVPALALAVAGIMLAFLDRIEPAIGGSLPSPAPVQANRLPPLKTGDAMVAALTLYPGADLTAVTMPAGDSPWYRIRLKAPGEMPRKYGASTVIVSALHGRVLLNHDARHSQPARTIVEVLYPLHTGQVAGLPGRLINLAVGVWLIAMLTLGLLLWRKRRPVRQGLP